MGENRTIEIKEQVDALKQGERTAGISTLTIILLAAAEAMVGILAVNIILITDALHNAADSMVSFASWFGLKISQRKPDKKFPYGYYKAESLTTLLVAIGILYAAFELLVEGYSRIYIVSEITMPLEALSIALVSAITSYFLAKYLRNVGEKINSKSLVANAQERITHVFSSIIIFITILSTLYKIPYVEGLVTMFFSLVIFRIGIFTIKDSIFALMDVCPSKDVEEGVEEIINSIAGVEGFEHLKLRKAGPFVFGEVTVKIRKQINVEKAYEIANSIENTIKNALKNIDSITIQVEPYETAVQRLVIPINQDRALNSEIADKFGRANYFMFIIIDKTKKNVKATNVKANPYRTEAVRAGFTAVNFIVTEKIDALITKELGDISFHTLRSHLVDIYKVEGKTINEVLTNYLKGTLKHLEEPTKKEKIPIIKKEIGIVGEQQPRRRRGPRWRRQQ